MRDGAVHLATVNWAVLDVIADAGFAITLNRVEGGFVAIAASASGQRWRARGTDAYKAVCELARRLGIDAARARPQDCWNSVTSAPAL